MSRARTHVAGVVVAVLTAFATLEIGSRYGEPRTAGAESTWEIPKLLIESVSGERAKTHVVEISRFYREDATPGFHEAATYIVDTAKKAGLQEVHIEAFPVDGKNRYLNMQSRYAWAPRRGELWLADPPTKIADFLETSTHLATWSISGNVNAELVDIGTGMTNADYAEKDVRGKLVLTTSVPSAVQAEAVGKRGAAGIVSYWSPPSRQAFPDQVQWLDTGNNRQDVKAFAFVLSRRQGLALKEKLTRGTVKLRAVVDADLGAGNLEVVSGLIPGSEMPDEEIILVAHVCHFTPSSNDDASGCGALLEMARAWQDLIQRGVLARPRRTIRFLWVPENYGTVAFLSAHPERAQRGKAVLDLDMVGEDLDRCNALLRIIRTPESRPSFINDLVSQFADQIAGAEIVAPSGSRSVFRYTQDDYVGGSDHLWFNDAGIGVPAVLFMHWPDNFYHSNEDTPDKVDPSELRRVSLIALSSARLLSQMGSGDILPIAHFTAARAQSRLAVEMSQAFRYGTTPETSLRARKRLRARLELEAQTIASLSSMSAEQKDSLASLAAAFRKEQETSVAACLQRLPPPSAEPAFPEGGWIAERRGRYLSSMWRNNLRDRLNADEMNQVQSWVAELPYGDLSAFELFNLVDGKRTLGEIADILETEQNSEFLFDEYFGDGSMRRPTPFRSKPVLRPQLASLLKLAEKAGLVVIGGKSGSH